MNRQTALVMKELSNSDYNTLLRQLPRVMEYVNSGTAYRGNIRLANAVRQVNLLSKKLAKQRQ
jgi:hypothetical protein